MFTSTQLFRRILLYRLCSTNSVLHNLLCSFLNLFSKKPEVPLTNIFNSTKVSIKFQLDIKYI